jgi:hypothetical protein
MEIGAIQWPTDANVAVKNYLDFQVITLKDLGITLPSIPNDPLLIVEKWTKGLLRETELDAARDAWWEVIDTPTAIRDFTSPQALNARLALCLLAVREKDAGSLGEHLSWFLEVLGFYGADVKQALALMRTHFRFA